MTIFSFLKLLPIYTLTLTLHHPNKRVLVFKRNLSRDFWLIDYPEKVLNVKSINIVPSLNSLGEKDISKGSLVGATASALLDRNILKGAIIGDWWQKEQDNVLYLVKIVLMDYQYQEMTYALKTSRTGVKTIKRFFKEKR